MEPNHIIIAVNKSYENVEKFWYLQRTLTKKNYMHEEMKGRLNMGNSCYHSVQNYVFPVSIKWKYLNT
jgi:hypothetical protein